MRRPGAPQQVPRLVAPNARPAMGDPNAEYALIAGTGFSDYAAGEPREINTPYGAAHIVEAHAGEQPIIFLPRHGPGHTVLPHQVNYRANIWALRSLGVRRILATASVGAINKEMQPGAFALLTQFLDFTRCRPATFFDQVGSTAMHVDMSDPYCPSLRRALTRAGEALGIAIHPAATYVCTDGPRFETPAEIHAFDVLGADVVGMTGVPEAPLAREANLCYASVAIITNWAAGVSAAPVSHQEVLDAMRDQQARVWRLLTDAIARHRVARSRSDRHGGPQGLATDPEPCSCAQAVDEALWR